MDNARNFHFSREPIGRRDLDGNVMTEPVCDVPHVWKAHSPSGLEWGYSGSGPADTALNILLALGLDREEAWCWHQHVKGRFVAKLPREGGTISGAEVVAYVAVLRQKLGGAT